MQELHRNASGSSDPDPGQSSYAFSRDGREWTQAATPPYDCTIRFTEASGGGGAVATGCGNRPQIHFGNSGDPEILINGANAAQPGTPNHYNTWTLFRPLSQAPLKLDDEVQLEWSNPVLIEDFTYHLGGPFLVAPDHFFGFDDKHIYGLGFNGSWQFSSDSGKSWKKTHTPHNVPHGESPMLPIKPHSFRSLGGGIFSNGEHGWTLQWPRVYSLLPDGSGFTITVAQGGAGPHHNVTFVGVPYPGVNLSAHALIKSGTRNYGVVRAANGKYVMQTDILWNRLPFLDDQMSSIVSFISSDGFAWRYGGVIANWSSVKGNLTDEDNTRNVLNPVRYGPSEIDLTVLSDNRTLLSVVRMDGDDACFHKTVPPHERNAKHTEYRNYAASYSSDGVSWSAPRPIEGTGCARPKLKKLTSGVLLLSGGRLCVENKTGIFLWVNSDGMGGYRSKRPGTSTWERHSITAQHNRLWTGDDKYLFSEMVNDSSVFETLSYTSIVPGM